MGSNNKSYYTQRNAEMRQRYADGESVNEIMLFSGLKIQRTCQILGILYRTAMDGVSSPNNGHKAKPEKQSTQAIGPYWVTCNQENKSFLEWYKPDRCKYCQKKDLKIEKQVWTKPIKESAP